MRESQVKTEISSVKKNNWVSESSKIENQSVAKSIDVKDI